MRLDGNLKIANYSLINAVDADIHIRTDIIAGYPYPAYHQTNY